jgi:hypothetical protein
LLASDLQHCVVAVAGEGRTIYATQSGHSGGPSNGALGCGHLRLAASRLLSRQGVRNREAQASRRRPGSAPHGRSRRRSRTRRGGDDERARDGSSQRDQRHGGSGIRPERYCTVGRDLRWLPEARALPRGAVGTRDRGSGPSPPLGQPQRASEPPATTSSIRGMIGAPGRPERPRPTCHGGRRTKVQFPLADPTCHATARERTSAPWLSPSG